MKRVFVCSPLSPKNGKTLTHNMRIAELLSRAATKEGAAVFTPHVLYTQYLSDDSLLERDQAIASALEFLKICDEIWVYARDVNECSTGMRGEIEVAMRFEIPVIWMPPCFEPVGVIAERAMSEGPITASWLYQRTVDLQRQAEAAHASLLAQAGAPGSLHLAQLEVERFHDAMKINARPDSPRLLSARERDRRVDLLKEEVKEYVDASEAGSAVEIVDGLIDTIYIALGTLSCMGLDAEPFWKEIHRTNMAKLDGHFDPVRGKWVKPEGWMPPRIFELLVEQGANDSLWPDEVTPVAPGGNS